MEGMLLLIFPILVLAQENPEPQDGVRSFHFLEILFSWRGHNFYSFFDWLWLSSLWLTLKKYKFEIKTDEKTNKYISCSLFSPLLDLEVSNRASNSCPGGTPTVAATTLGRLLSTPSTPSTQSAPSSPSPSSSSYDTVIHDFMIFPQRWTSPNNPTARELLLAPLTTTLGIGEEASGGLSSTISYFFYHFKWIFFFVLSDFDIKHLFIPGREGGWIPLPMETHMLARYIVELGWKLLRGV